MEQKEEFCTEVDYDALLTGSRNLHYDDAAADNVFNHEENLEPRDESKEGVCDDGIQEFADTLEIKEFSLISSSLLSPKGNIVDDINISASEFGWEEDDLVASHLTVSCPDFVSHKYYIKIESRKDFQEEFKPSRLIAIVKVLHFKFILAIILIMS